MDAETLKKLVQRGEGQRLEFKRKVADARKIVREAVAFANSGGGTLLIGVGDDGGLPGLRYPEEEAFVLEAALQKHCKPAISYELEYVRLTPIRTVLRFEIADSPRKPVFLIYNLRSKRGRAYVRYADKSVQSSREVRKILKARSLSAESGGFSYGEHESLLVKYLDAHAEVDLPTFAKLAGISAEAASDLLVRMTLNNVIEIHPRDVADVYTLKEEESD